MPPLIGDKPLTAAERQRRYRERNAEKVRESQQRWLAANPERRREIARAFYLRNREESMARSIAWRAANLDAARRHRMESHYRNYAKDIMRMSARRAHVRAFVVTDKDVRRLMSQACAECGSSRSLHVDHIVPLSRGGRHAIGNLQMLCQSCNLSKNNRLTVEWRRHKAARAA